MNRDPFLRLALVTLATLDALGLLVIAAWLGFWQALFAALLGIVLTIAATFVLTPKPPDDEPAEDLRQRRRQPAEGTRGFERIE